MMMRFIPYLFIFLGMAVNAQEDSLETLTFRDFLILVKENHPIVKQANLLTETGAAKLLKARGGFDPKIEVDFDQKVFKETEYYNLLNATFKIPTWYGID